MTTPRLALPYYVDGQTLPQATLGQQANFFDWMASPRVETWQQNTPPGSPSDGDGHLVGSSPTGAWAGEGGSIALYFAGWYFITPRSGMRVWRKDSTTKGNRGWFAYSEDESDWYPDGWRWRTATEHWTGRYTGEAGAVTTNEEKIWAKVVEISAFPNRTNTNVSYGGSLSIDLDYPVYHELSAAHSTPIVLPVPHGYADLPIDISFRVASFDLICLSLDLSDFKGTCYLEYVKAP